MRNTQPKNIPDGLKMFYPLLSAALVGEAQVRFLGAALGCFLGFVLGNLTVGVSIGIGAGIILSDVLLRQMKSIRQT
jgi:hypothetical protein